MHVRIEGEWDRVTIQSKWQLDIERLKQQAREESSSVCGDQRKKEKEKDRMKVCSLQTSSPCVWAITLWVCVCVCLCLCMIPWLNKHLYVFTQNEIFTLTFLTILWRYFINIFWQLYRQLNSHKLHLDHCDKVLKLIGIVIACQRLVCMCVCCLYQLTKDIEGATCKAYTPASKLTEEMLVWQPEWCHFFLSFFLFISDYEQQTDRYCTQQPQLRDSWQ